MTLKADEKDIQKVLQIIKDFQSYRPLNGLVNEHEVRETLAAADYLRGVADSLSNGFNLRNVASILDKLGWLFASIDIEEDE